jgi:colicin import membrane protein
MIPSADRRDQNPGWMFIISLALHILILFICSSTNLFKASFHEVTPYYVDIVSLPALEATSTEPQAQQTVPTPPPAPAVAPKTPVAPAMTLPEKPALKPALKLIPPAASSPGTADQEAREFAERMSHLEHSSEAKHQAAALDSLQKKATEQKRPSGGGGAAKGTGADYGSNIQSRLKDALVSTIVYRSQKPEAAVHLYIDKRGKLIKYVMIRPSPDKLFNDSVIRTIEKAKASFPPNPAGSDFDRLFVFNPQEVSK